MGEDKHKRFTERSQSCKSETEEVNTKAKERALAAAAARAFEELMLMEEREEDKKPIQGPMTHVRIVSKCGVVAQSAAPDKPDIFRGSMTVAWSGGEGGRRVQVCYVSMHVFTMYVIVCVRACVCLYRGIYIEGRLDV